MREEVDVEVTWREWLFQRLFPLIKAEVDRLEFELAVERAVGSVRRTSRFSKRGTPTITALHGDRIEVTWGEVDESELEPVMVRLAVGDRVVIGRGEKYRMALRRDS